MFFVEHAVLILVFLSLNNSDRQFKEWGWGNDIAILGMFVSLHQLFIPANQK